MTFGQRVAVRLGPMSLVDIRKHPSSQGAYLLQCNFHAGVGVLWAVLSAVGVLTILLHTHGRRIAHTFPP
jgi:hypothetical protein